MQELMEAKWSDTLWAYGLPIYHAACVYFKTSHNGAPHDEIMAVIKTIIISNSKFCSDDAEMQTEIGWHSSQEFIIYMKKSITISDHQIIDPDPDQVAM